MEIVSSFGVRFLQGTDLGQKITFKILNIFLYRSLYEYYVVYQNCAAICVVQSFTEQMVDGSACTVEKLDVNFNEIIP